MNKKYPYTEKYEREQREKADPNFHVKKSKINKGLLFSFIALGILAIATVSIWNRKQENSLLENGNQTFAIITYIRHDIKKMNEMEKKWIDNYYLEYRFIHQSNSVVSFKTIRQIEISNYFDKIPELGDSISILFNPNNPKKTALIEK